MYQIQAKLDAPKSSRRSYSGIKAKRVNLEDEEYKNIFSIGMKRTVVTSSSANIKRSRILNKLHTAETVISSSEVKDIKSDSISHGFLKTIDDITQSALIVPVSNRTSPPNFNQSQLKSVDLSNPLKPLSISQDPIEHQLQQQVLFQQAFEKQHVLFEPQYLQEMVLTRLNGFSTATRQHMYLQLQIYQQNLLLQELQLQQKYQQLESYRKFLIQQCAEDTRKCFNELNNQSHWFGSMRYDETKKHLVWNGAWIASLEKPSPMIFSSSKNAFEYYSRQVQPNEVFRDGVIMPVTGYYSSFYTNLDVNGNLEKFADLECFLDFEEIAIDTRNDCSKTISKELVVTGRGQGHLGFFILSGTYCPSNSLLHLSKEYVAADDSSIGMTIVELKSFFDKRNQLL